MSIPGQFFINLGWIQGPSRGDPWVKFQGFSGGPEYEKIDKFLGLREHVQGPSRRSPGVSGRGFSLPVSQNFEKFLGVPKSVQDPPGSIFSPSPEIFFPAENPSTNADGRSPQMATGLKVIFATSGRKQAPSDRKHSIRTFCVPP